MALHTSTVSGTTSATPGTRSTFQHGLTDAVGRARTPDFVSVVAVAADADGAITASEVQVVSYDATDVVVRAEAASVDVEIFAVADIHPITG